MPSVYTDTSALMKLYVPEIGSAWMHATAQRYDLVISWLTTAEVGTTLVRLSRDGTLTAQQARRAWRTFRQDCTAFIHVAVTQQTMLRVIGIANRVSTPLRTLDAIQLQGAVDAARAARRSNLPSPLFVAADQRLLLAAQALGFDTDNPLAHP